MNSKKVCMFSMRNIAGIFILAWTFYGLFSIRDFFIVLMLAVTISIFIEDFVVFFEKRKIPRPISAIFLYVLVFALFFGSFAIIVPILFRELGNLYQTYPQIFQSFPSLKHITNLFQSGDTQILMKSIDKENLQKLFEIFNGFFGGVVNLIIVFVLSFYISITKHGIDRFISLVSSRERKEEVLKFWHILRRKIEAWFRGQLILAFLVFILTLIGLSTLGVPYTFLLSFLAGVLGLIPYGIILALLPALTLSFNYGGIRLLILVLILYIFVQQIVDYVIQPLISKRMTGVPPVAVIISVIVSTKLFGFIGLILAVPIAIVVVELITFYSKSQGESEKI